MLADVRPHVVNAEPMLGNPRQILLSGRIWPKFLDLGPESVEFGPNLAESGPNWAMLVKCVPNVGTLGPKSAEFDRSRPPTGPTSTLIRSMLSDFEQI